MKAPELRFLILILMGCMSLARANAQSSATYDSRHDGDVKNEQAHIDSKMKWIKENPESYRKAGGDPNVAISKSEAAVENIGKEKADRPLAAFAVARVYQFVSLKVVAVPGSQLSRAEMEQVEQSIKRDEWNAETLLQYDGKGGVRLYSPGKYDRRATEVSNGRDLEWRFVSQDCETCSKSLYLKLLSDSDDQRVLLVSDEDEGSSVAFVLTFESTK